MVSTSTRATNGVDMVTLDLSSSTCQARRDDPEASSADFCFDHARMQCVSVGYLKIFDTVDRVHGQEIAPLQPRILMRSTPHSWHNALPVWALVTIISLAVPSLFRDDSCMRQGRATSTTKFFSTQHTESRE